MRNFCKTLFFGIIFAGAAGIGYTQIDQGELQKNLAPVSFTSYEGPHARIETREQIRQIGVGLGQAIKAGGERAGTGSRYFVIHSVSAPDGNKLDADIFGLGANTGVDHIRNLRTIIQGYLQEAYSYSAQDAALLAEYITIYNAVYRGNWDYFSERYKKPVIGNLNPQQAGLATRYNEWPGKTLMVIPLGMGGISSIDTSLISDNRVVEEMRREDDKGIEQRRNMVDLKEREAAAAELKATNQRETVRKEETAIAAEKSQLEKDRQQLAEDKAQGAVTPAEAAEQESELQQKSDDLEQRESELALQREEAEKQEQFAEKKTEEAQQERESIAKDQQAIIDRGETPQNLIGIILERSDAVMGRLVAINPATRREVRRSQLNTVYVRTLTFIGGKILAIAGENKDNGAIRLIEIDGRTLEMAKQGNDDMHPNSLIWVNGSDLYAITANLANGTLNLGRFNADLVLQAKSVIAVSPNASVSVQQGSLLTQRADGSAAFLNPADLTEQQ
jgi:hypothetical protein